MHSIIHQPIPPSLPNQIPPGAIINLRKPKKRRKRHKQLKTTNALIVDSASGAGVGGGDDDAIAHATTTRIVKKTIATKTKQYFQHDTRLEKERQSVRTTSSISASKSASASSSSSIYYKYSSEREQLLYAAVARKFKPLFTIEPSKKIIAKQKRRRLGTKALLNKQRLKRKMTSTRKKEITSTAALTHYCMCSCNQTSHRQCVNNLNERLSLNGASNTNNTTNLCGLSKMFELLQQHTTPTAATTALLLNSLIQSTKILNENKLISKR